MNNSPQSSTSLSPILRVAAGADRFGEQRGLGISNIDFKVCTQDSGGILILENTFHGKGGPARHLHYDQDEWFYVAEGNFLSKSIRNDSGSHLVIRCWRRVACRTFGRTLARRAAGL